VAGSQPHQKAANNGYGSQENVKSPCFEHIRAY
jgi:hypothetical protein